VVHRITVTDRSAQSGRASTYPMFSPSAPHLQQKKRAPPRDAAPYGTIQERPRQCASTVSEIALGWGFEHTGDFTADYYRLFGELPSQTLRVC
jgi:AraC-like DNA-binding protein